MSRRGLRRNWKVGNGGVEWKAVQKEEEERVEEQRDEQEKDEAKQENRQRRVGIGGGEIREGYDREALREQVSRKRRKGRGGVEGIVGCGGGEGWGEIGQQKENLEETAKREQKYESRSGGQEQEQKDEQERNECGNSWMWNQGE